LKSVSTVSTFVTIFTEAQSITSCIFQFGSSLQIEGAAEGAVKRLNASIVVPFNPSAPGATDSTDSTCGTMSPMSVTISTKMIGDFIGITEL